MLIDKTEKWSYNVLSKRAKRWVWPAAGNIFTTLSSAYVCRQRALLFAYNDNNKRYHRAKHNHKLDKIRISNHWHQLLSVKVR